MDRKIRVLVVDDSAFVRQSVTRMLSSDPAIEVVGTARDGLDALEKIKALAPDVVTLDLIMPNLDGIGVLQALRAEGTRVPVVVCSIASEGGQKAIAALEAGAVALVQKPTALALDTIYEIEAQLVHEVKAAAAAAPERLAPPAPEAPAPAPAAVPAPAASRYRLLAIGASTGGPQALRFLLPQLPEGFPVPVAVVVHMPVGFTGLFAEHLDAVCPLAVVEATDGTPVEPGTILIAPAGIHLKFRREGDRVAARLDPQPAQGLHRPSVNELFRSAAEVFGEGVLGVVLTGMGDDGTEGARVVKERGGRILAEAEASCVVYGMPRSVAEAGLVDRVAPLEAMADLILEEIGRG
ncbi:protein-glutamate methylesterase/protein-glutamine glutaminase [Deferrisoma sp.]